MRLLSRLLDLANRAGRRLWMLALRPLFGSHGKRFLFDPRGCYSFSNIYVGDDVSLGWKPVLLAAQSEIHIGSKVMFGPEVVVVGGGHNTSVAGRFMIDVHEKTGNEDLGVIIEDDVWVGARAVILRGVTVGRGSIVAAGAVVTKSVPPYAIVTGNPARVLRFRWDVEAILRHEESLYSPEKRFQRAWLEEIQVSAEMLPPKRMKA
jgi:maltose O-acetyltransferase